MGDKVQTSRLGRLGRLGWVSRHALPIAWRRLREVSESDPEKRGQVAEAAVDEDGAVAEDVLRALGDMKGLALKLGQTLAYMDGVLPAGYRAAYKKALAPLLQRAPALPWSAIEPVLIEDLGRPVAEAFASFETEPFAAASIGQVHRAKLHSGEAVAVKVQYPGVDRAVAADLKNLATFQSLAAPLLGLSGRGAIAANHKEIVAEVRDRLLEETDYIHEARQQERFRLLFASDPEVWIPRVIEECSGRRVLTSEFVDGSTLHEVAALAPQEERDRIASVLTRVMLRSLYDHHLFNADPHPGNYLFPADGRVVFLDFGCTKEIPAWMGAQMQRYMRAAVHGTAEVDRRGGKPGDDVWAEFDAAVADALKLNPRADSFVIYRDFMLYCLRPFLRDEPFEFTEVYTGASIDLVLDGLKKTAFAKGRIPRIPDLPPAPADFTFLSRLQWGFYSVLTMLRAKANWHRMLPSQLREG